MSDMERLLQYSVTNIPQVAFSFLRLCQSCPSFSCRRNGFTVSKINCARVKEKVNIAACRFTSVKNAHRKISPRFPLRLTADLAHPRSIKARKCQISHFSLRRNFHRSRYRRAVKLCCLRKSLSITYSLKSIQFSPPSCYTLYYISLPLYCQS